jgi:hypothetical protein
LRINTDRYLSLNSPPSLWLPAIRATKKTRAWRVWLDRRCEPRRGVLTDAKQSSTAANMARFPKTGIFVRIQMTTFEIINSNFEGVK